SCGNGWLRHLMRPETGLQRRQFLAITLPARCCEKGSSMGRRAPIALALVVLCLAAGCLSARRYPPPNLSPSARLVQVEPRSDQPTLPAVVQAAHTDPAAPRVVLALSGGGLYGAYTTGVLKGWSDAGIRPQFDVVTGISTGALIAPLAFLGS